MIERRARKGEVDPDEKEELWKVSVRAHNSRREQENRAAWVSFHQDQAARHRAVLKALVKHHEAAAARLAAASLSLQATDGRRTA
jgi:hypothetical protein